MYTLGAEIAPYHDFSLEDSLRSLADMGLTHVNLWSSASPLAHHVNPGDDIGAIKASLRRYGITPTGLTMYGKSQDEMRQRIEMAAELEIPYVVFDCEEHYPNFVSRFLPPLLETCERRHQHGPATIEAAAVADLPDVLDAERVVPDEAVARNSPFTRLAVLEGEAPTLQAARHPRAMLTTKQAPSALMSQRWWFSQGELISVGRFAPKS